MSSSALTRLRKISLELPEAHEVEAWDTPTFRIRNKIFVIYTKSAKISESHRPAICIKAGPGEQEVMVNNSPDRFFIPMYLGGKGWVGVWLDNDPDWKEIAILIRDSYRLIAPKKLAMALSDSD